MSSCLVSFGRSRSRLVSAFVLMVAAATVFVAAVPRVARAADRRKTDSSAGVSKGHPRGATPAGRDAKVSGHRDPRAGKGSGGGRQAAKKGRGKVAAKPPALPPARGKVAVFVFKGDDAAASERVRAQVIRALRARGLRVVTTLRPVDSAEQFREMAVTLNLAVYVDGEVSEDADQASATVHVRSGVTGLRVASATFSGERRKLAADVGKALWGEVGESFSKVCADAAKPRKQDRAPLRIEAGTPIENSSPEGT